MLDPIVKTIEVPCDKEKAFDVFVQEMPSWWPIQKFSMSMKSGQPPKGLRVEAKLGGRIVETGHDDAEHVWGSLTAYEPHDFVRMDFHMGMPPEMASVVEVRFSALDARRTQVELTQSNWEAFGDMAEMLRGHYGSAWTEIFGTAYMSACGA